MSDDKDDSQPIDYLAIIEEFQPLRETIRGVVAMFVADGFTDEQARVLAVYTATGYRTNDNGSTGG